MLHRQQRQSSTSLRFGNSIGSTANNSYNSLSTEYSSPLMILSKRCSWNRSRTSTTSTSAASSSTRCSSSTGATSLPSYSVLLSILTWSVMLLLISSCPGIADAKENDPPEYVYRLSKEDFMNIDCNGNYETSHAEFASLDRICEDCYYLTHEPDLYVDCKSNCFTTEALQFCVESLLMKDQAEDIRQWIRVVSGADPTF